jgi:hypothetical protein
VTSFLGHVCVVCAWLLLHWCAQERSRLDIARDFHFGDLVNRFRTGSLAMLPAEVVEDASLPGVAGESLCAPLYCVCPVTLYVPCHLLLPPPPSRC